MARKYKERKCPVCGDLGERPDTICNACMRYARMGRRYEASIRSYLNDEEVYDRMRVDIWDAWHFGKMAGLWPEYNTEGLVLELLKLARAVIIPGQLFAGNVPSLTWCAPDENIFKRSRGTSYGYHPTYRTILTLGQTTALEEILQWIHDVMEMQYKEGVSRGRSILRSLAEAGVDELNRTVMSKK